VPTVHHPGAASPITDLAGGLFSTAHWIWDRRRQAKATGFPFSEETVTETVLLDLASALSNVIHIVPFTKPKEGETGADWEWCLYDLPNNRYLRFLVQAKVLDDKDQVYAHIDRYIGNTGVRQIDRLAETSAARGVPALYAFYNHVTDRSRVPTDRCGCHGCLPCWGASVAPLEAVLTALPDKSFDTLRHVSMPWLCMLCAGKERGRPTDPIIGALLGMARLEAMARDYFPASRRHDLPPLASDPQREPPDYLRTLLGVDAAKIMEPDMARASRAARDNPDLDGVVLIDAARRQPD